MLAPRHLQLQHYDAHAAVVHVPLILDAVALADGADLSIFVEFFPGSDVVADVHY